MKEFLSQHRVAYRDLRVDESLEAYDELLARGYRMVPVTCAGSHCVKGFDVEALRQLIAGLSTA